MLIRACHFLQQRSIEEHATFYFVRRNILTARYHAALNHFRRNLFLRELLPVRREKNRAQAVFAIPALHDAYLLQLARIIQRVNVGARFAVLFHGIIHREIIFYRLGLFGVNLLEFVFGYPLRPNQKLRVRIIQLVRFGVDVNSERVKPLYHRLPVLNLVIEFVAHAEPAQPAYRAVQKNLRFHRVVVAPVHDVFGYAAPHLTKFHIVTCTRQKVQVVSIETLVAA